MTEHFPWNIIIPKYLGGMDVKELEKQFGFTHRALYNAIKKRDIKPRGRKIGANSHTWKTGRSISGKYIYAWVDPNDPLIVMANHGKNRSNNRVAEHRLVMARHLGRPLTSDEEVHHIDGNTFNNALNNLQLRKQGHSGGQVFECVNCGSHNIKAINL